MFWLLMVDVFVPLFHSSVLFFVARTVTPLPPREEAELVEYFRDRVRDYLRLACYQKMLGFLSFTLYLISVRHLGDISPIPYTIYLTFELIYYFEAKELNEAIGNIVPIRDSVYCRITRIQFKVMIWYAIHHMAYVFISTLILKNGEFELIE